MTLKPALTVVAAACCTVLAGCTIPTAAGPAMTPAGSARPSTAATAPTAVTTPAEDGGAAAQGIDPANPPKPVGVVQLACSTDSGLDRVSIGVLGVQRRGKLAVATFVVTGVRNASYKQGVPGQRGELGYCSPAAVDPRVIDSENLVSYSPIKGEGLPTINAYGVFPSVTPTYLSAVFPAPATGVTKVDVSVGLGTVAGVPLT